MSKKQIIFSWILTVIFGGFLSAALVNALYGSSFFSILELGLMIAGISAGAGTIPLITSLIVNTISSRKKVEKKWTILYHCLTQIVFGGIFILAFALRRESDYIYISLVFLGLSLLLTVPIFLKLNAK